ncbi:HU family DNA-binding protein [Chromobacterium vaccinii]|uniref:HU family DNA-binding protein n=1 Tax=Chromobacterium vaccinii TaxID=1108595 RepID=UPI003C793040
MTKSDLIERLTNCMQIRYDRAVSKTDVTAFLDALGDVAVAELQAGGEAPLPGLGRLTVKETATRTGRNPKTGEPMEIQGRRAPKFAAAKGLKDALK